MIDALIDFNAKEAIRKDANGNLSYTKSKIKSFKKKITTLRHYRRYLETNPTQAFVEKMRDDTRKKVHAIDDRYGEWLENNKFMYPTEPLKVYRRLMERKHYMEQIKTLEFLLKD